MTDQRLCKENLWHEKAGSYALLFTLFLVPLVFSTRTYDNFALHKAVLFHCATAWLAVCVSLCFMRSREACQKFIFSPIVFPLFLFFLFCTASLLISPDPQRGFLGVYQRFDGYYHCVNLILFYACAVVTLQHTGLSAVAACIMVSSFFAALYAVIQHLGMDIFLWQSLDRRSISTFGHANTLATFLSMVFPFALSEYLFPVVSRKSGAYRAICFLLCVLLFFALLTTFSRAGYVAWLSGSVFLLMLLSGSPFIDRKQMFIRLSALMICFCACVLFVQVQAKREVLPVTLKERVFSLTNARESTVRERVLIWETVFKIIRKFPVLGCGFESLKSVFPEFKSKELALAQVGSFYVADKAHNEYFHIAVTTGLAGLFAYLWLLFSALLAVRSAVLKHRSGDARHYGFSAMLFSSLIAYSVNIMFGFSTVATQVYFYFIMAGISVLAMNARHDPEKADAIAPVSLSSSGKYMTALFAAVFLLGTMTWNGRVWMADAYYKKATSVSASSVDAALFFLEQSARLNPVESEYAFALAREYSRLYTKKNGGPYFRKALTLYQSLLEQNGRDVDVMHFYAVLLAAYGKKTRQAEFLKEAVYVLRKAHAFSPHYPLYLTRLGEIYFDLAEFENGQVNLQKALQAGGESLGLEPLSYDTQFLLAKVFYKQKKYGDALQRIQFILMRHPRDHALYVWMGNIYQETGEFEEAIRAYHTALKTGHSFPAGIFTEMAKAYLNLKDREKALKCLEQALWLQPGYAAAQSLLRKMTEKP